MHLKSNVTSARAFDIVDHDKTPIRHIFRWDLDKTYLRTDFDSLRDLIRTAIQKPEERLNVPGSDALLRELSRHNTQGRAYITFISGSPTQMRKKIEQKFVLDGVKPDAFILKPQLEYLIRGKFKAIRGQVGYKLEALLRVRHQSPLAPETLFGDDAEQDAFIYSVYSDVVAGHLNVSELRDILYEARVYPDTRDLILERAEQLEHADTVQRIFIHLDRRSAPGRFLVFGPRVIPITNYFQAALMLFEDEVLDAQGLCRVAADMMATNDYGLMELGNSYQDLSRRGHIGLGAVDRLNDERELLHQIEGFPPHFTDRLLKRLRALAPRGEVPKRAQSLPDYIEVLRADRALRESVKESRPKRRWLFFSK